MYFLASMLYCCIVKFLQAHELIIMAVESRDLQAACIEAAREELQSHGYYVIGVVGQSKAGCAALVHASAIGSVPRIVSCAATLDWSIGEFAYMGPKRG